MKIKDPHQVTSVLFVCMGNICRSPTAEGVFRHLVNEAGLAEHFDIDSAGTHAYHVGEPPDRRAVAAAERRGISLENIAARHVSDEDFERFDIIVAMDEDNQQRLLDQAPAAHRSKVRNRKCPIPTTVVRLDSSGYSILSSRRHGQCFTHWSRARPKNVDHVAGDMHWARNVIDQTSPGCPKAIVLQQASRQEA